MKSLQEFGKQVLALEDYNTDSGQIMVSVSKRRLLYQTVVLTTLLYGSESWTWYRQHVRNSSKICGISWKDKVPSTAVLKHCKLDGIEALLIKGQLGWAGHVVRMDDNRIQKAVFYGEITSGQRSRGGQYKRY